MRKSTRIPGLIIVAALVVAGFSSNLSAATLLQDNFDSYADQSSFVTVWPQVGTNAIGQLTNSQSVSAPNSIFNVGTTVAGEAMRNQRSFAESGTPSSANVVTFSFDFYDGNAAAGPYRSHSNLQDGTAPGSYGQLVSMGLNNNQLSTANGGNFYMARILVSRPRIPVGPQDPTSS